MFHMKLVVIFCVAFFGSCLFLEGYVETNDLLQTILDDTSMDVDFDGYHISLRNEMGTLIDETFCDPFGYFIFHLDSTNGRYIVHVDARGVSFDSESVRVDVREFEKSGRPLRFLVTGFSIFGNVRERSLDGTSGSGPESLSVKLVGGSGKERFVLTGSEGRFEFDDVLPGKYEIFVEGVDESADCDLGSVPLDVEDDRLIIEGYYVKGRVKDCSTSMVLQLSHEFGSWTEDVTPSCEFSFAEVPSGRYELSVVLKEGDTFKISPDMIQVHVKGGNIDLSPNEDDFNFELTGITVSGKVVNPLTNQPVSGAEVFVDGSVASKTQDDGSFQLVDIGTGSVDIEVSMDGLKFSKLEDTFIHPNEPLLPDIQLSHCKVCGKLEDKSIRRQVVLESLVLEEKKMYKVFTDEGHFCKYLPVLDFERFSVRVVSLDKESKITDYPQVDYSIVDFIDQSEDTIIELGKKRYNVNVKIQYFEKDGSTERKGVGVTIEPIVDSEIIAKKMKMQRQRFLGKKAASGDEDSIILEEIVTTDDLVTFEGLLLGRYKVSVYSQTYCFDDSSVVLLVVGEGSVVEVKVVGIKANFKSTFLDSLGVVVEGTEQTKHEIPKGDSSLCLTNEMFKNDKISIVPDPEECFVFDDANNIIINLYDPVELIVYDKPERYRVDFQVKLVGITEGRDSILLATSSSLDGFEKVVTLEPSSVDLEKKERSSLFHFETTIEKDVVLRVIPTSQSYLFTPSEYEYKTIESSTCPVKPDTIVAETGVFFEGRVTRKTNSKPLEGVSIKVYDGYYEEEKEDESDSFTPKMVLEGSTNSNGEYRIGPLRNNPNYFVDASMDDFVMAKKQGEEEENVIKCDFVAEELSSLRIIVEHESKFLKDVLVSVSSSSKRRKGIEYSQVQLNEPVRSHGLTDEKGEVMLKNLYPGEYYIKFGLREYEFDLVASESSENVKVKDQKTGSNFMILADLGSTEKSKNTVVRIQANRFEFSAFGVVQSLNMKPVHQARVTAERKEKGIVEESVSDSEGRFRIKGLIPGEAYKISVLSDTGSPQPSFYEFTMKKEDLTGLDFIDFSRNAASLESGKDESSFYGLVEITEDERHEMLEKGSSFIEKSAMVQVLDDEGKLIGESSIGLGRAGLGTFNIPCELGEKGRIRVPGWVDRSENTIEEGKFKHIIISSQGDEESSGRFDARPFFGTAVLVIFLGVFRLLLVSPMEE